MTILVLLAGLVGATDAPDDLPVAKLTTNTTWEVLAAKAAPRDKLAAASSALQKAELELAGTVIDGSLLAELAATSEDEPLVRAVRERVGQAVDLPDFLLFLDDVLAAERLEERFFIPAGRARSAGILLHPDDVFKKDKARKYGTRGLLAVDEPAAQETYPPAKDGALLGPEWTTRFQNPSELHPMLEALYRQRPEHTYASRVAALVMQLEHAGAGVYLTSTVRSRERGYLMYGAFALSRAEEREVPAKLAYLEGLNKSWKLEVPIVWSHPDGPAATKEAARVMADTYDVVYATEKGARWSHHYSGVAADFVAVGLPRSLRLIAPDGADHTFDLSDPGHTRDLSLSPEVISWIEEHFGMKKLRSDYPHWNDANR